MTLSMPNFVLPRNRNSVVNPHLIQIHEPQVEQTSPVLRMRSKSASRMHASVALNRNLTFFFSSISCLPILLVVFLSVFHCCLPFAEAGCRTTSGMPMCCLGRQSACSSFTTDNRSNRTRFRRYLPTLPQKRCFCDEHCTVTNDCCPDYRDVCHKPVVDCKVSAWGPWAECNRQCGRGTSVRRRRVIQPATNGGRHCPVLEETRSCQGTQCASRRVGRSGALTIPYMYQPRGEVAQLLPVRGDVMQMLRQHDMRWDVRRKLYLGRLIQQNLTEQPEPEPYCAIYEITHANPACQTHNLLWQYGDANRYVPYPVNSHPYYSTRRRRSWGAWNSPGPHSKRLLSDWGMTNTWSHVWMTHAALLSPGQQICVTCYPAYIRCPAVGYIGVETRWRALRTADCQGTFRLVTTPQQSCTCGHDVASFVFV